METVSYQHLQDLFVAITPLTLESGVLRADDKLKFDRLANRLLRRGWEWNFWPVLMDFEERHYRDSWAAGSYAQGAEIWHDPTAKYYVAATAAILTDVPGVSAAWTVLTQLDAYVGYEQNGETPFSHVKEVWSDNFRTTSPAIRLPWDYDERGVRLTKFFAPPSAWIYFRTRAKTWRGPDWDSAASIAAGQSRFFADATDDNFEGDFWLVLTGTSAAESPKTTPAKWERIAIPSFLADFAANAASSAFRKSEAELNQQLMNQDSEIWSSLYDEAEKLSFGMHKLATAINT